MGEPRDPDAARPNSEATTSSILGQAPFKLDLRVAPRPRVPPGSRREHGADMRLTPVGDVRASASAPASDDGMDERAAPAEVPRRSAPTAVSTPDAAELVAAMSAKTVAPPSQLTLPRRAPTSRPAAQSASATPAAAGRPSRSRPRSGRSRAAVGMLFTLSLLVAGIAGGVYAVKTHVLAPEWREDVEGLGDAVAARRGLEWRHAVAVEVLPHDEYAVALAASSLGVSAADPSALDSEWRAMGLAEGRLDLLAIGSAALADQPAFYDAAAGTILEVDGISSELRAIALSRALTLALLDQHFDWSGGSPRAQTGQTVATRALFDGDTAALQGDTTVAALTDPTLVANVAKASDELAGLRAQPLATGAQVPPIAIGLVGASGDATSPLFHETITNLDRTRLEQLPVTNDAAIFDAARGRDAQAVDLGVAGAKTAGMMYWYYALAGRTGSDGAWAAALHWNGDATHIERTRTSFCVRSTIATIDAAGQHALVQALDQWAALAPAGAQTVVQPVGDDRIDVASCDPGPDADTIRYTDISVLGHAPREMAVIGAMLAAGLADTAEARACVVRSLRSGQVVPVTDPEGLDRSLTRPFVDLTTTEAVTMMETCGTF